MIKLRPQQNNSLPALTVVKSGEVYTINGNEYDFTQLADGDYLPDGATDCEYILGEVIRDGADLNMTLLCPYSGHGTQSERYPSQVDNTSDGVLI